MSFEGNFNPLNKPRELDSPKEEETELENDSDGIGIEPFTPAKEYYGRFDEILKNQIEARQANQDKEKAKRKAQNPVYPSYKKNIYPSDKSIYYSK